LVLIALTFHFPPSELDELDKDNLVFWAENAKKYQS